ncbi:hypothetical protein SBF1_3990003 [Candidatus Desulfosporosinus infrequens]|uniref:Uncharacterized protein n=1 Tax=Candidatus Desulfosporosinus infrequens TaxID=2043169 RepID=A0A2U3L827_9FIRM|nr:hypothetical protein SBF1_3990003 [Candidatus Desulfosporosinus infrequens]
MCQQITILEQGTQVEIGSKTAVFEQPRTKAGAKITGCANITGCNLMLKNQIQVNDWGCVLDIGQAVSNKITSVGIRANHLRFCDQQDLPNSFGYQIKSIKEMPDKIILLLKITEQQIVWLKVEIDRQYWQNYSEQLPPYVQLPTEKLLLLA